MTYRFDFEHRSSGALVVRCNGMAADSEHGMARLLVECDFPDGPIEAGVVGRLHYTVRSMHAFAAAGVAAAEVDSGCLHPTLRAAHVELWDRRRQAEKGR